MKYVAFIRAIGPTDGNDRLRRAFENAGFKNVSSLLSSGNVLFESEREATHELEVLAEQALEAELGRHKAVLVRSQAELLQLVAKNPFPGMVHSPKTSLNVTFLKNKSDTGWKFPHEGKDKNYTVLGMYDREIYGVIDTLSAKTPDYMVQLEREFGKDITTRTWLTVQRVLKKMEG